MVVSTVDQIQNGLSPEFLQQLFNPTAIGLAHQQQLEALVQTHPQCSIFRLLLAKSVQNADVETAEKAVQSAAVYAANREILFRLIHLPELLIKPEPNQFYNFSLPETAARALVFEKEKPKDEKITFAETYPVEVFNTSFIDPKPAEIEDEEAVFVEDVPEEIPAEEITDASFIDPKPAEIEDEEAVFVEDVPEEISVEEITDAAFIDPNLEETIAAENDFRVEDVAQTFVNEADKELVFSAEKTILASEENLNRPQNFASQEIDEEVYDEITAIEDIHFEAVKEASKTNQPKPEIDKPEKAAETALPPAQDEAEKAMLSNIAAIDYFTFNHKFGRSQTPETETASTETTDDQADKIDPDFAKPEVAEEKLQEPVSKYHDDKMPYTFMWWLDRTRKEYAGTYQPYVKNMQQPPVLSVGPELHQQYIESIFHAKAPLKVPENVLPPVAEPFVKRRENPLIERFIIEEPHIHPPSMDKLDTENKAKRSSEDGDILVTETLAKIYLDQMLYHKALDTYKKLVLKFPEKSVYFAAQITEIEKKIN